jgi:hypothetical protein
VSRALYFQEVSMTLIAKTETTIKCSAAHAFSVVSNMERFGDWFPSVKSIKSVNDFPHGKVGKKYNEIVSIPLSGDREIEITVKESIKNVLFVTEGQFAPLLPRMEVAITETGENEIFLQWSMYSRSASKAVKMLLLPLAKSTMQKRANIGANKLKGLLEGSH